MSIYSCLVSVLANRTRIQAMKYISWSVIGVAPVVYMTSSFHSDNLSGAGSIIVGSAMIHFADSSRPLLMKSPFESEGITNPHYISLSVMESKPFRRKRPGSGNVQKSLRRLRIAAL